MYLKAGWWVVQGHYPVIMEDAAQMAALQTHAEFGPTLLDDLEGLEGAIERFITKQAPAAPPAPPLRNLLQDCGPQPRQALRERTSRHVQAQRPKAGLSCMIPKSGPISTLRPVGREAAGVSDHAGHLASSGAAGAGDHVEAEG